jgi:hypothetical protein
MPPCRRGPRKFGPGGTRGPPCAFEFPLRVYLVSGRDHCPPGLYTLNGLIQPSCLLTHGLKRVSPATPDFPVRKPKGARDALVETRMECRGVGASVLRPLSVRQVNLYKGGRYAAHAVDYRRYSEPYGVMLSFTSIACRLFLRLTGHSKP